MKYEFNTTLTGDDVQLITNSIKEDQEIKSIKCDVKWSMEPSCSSHGVKFWNFALQRFEVNMVLINTDTLEEENVIFDDMRKHDMTIEADNYRLHMDLILTTIVINRPENEVVAYIQGE